MTLISLFLMGFVLRTVIGLRSSLAGLTAHSASVWAVAACCMAMTALSLRLVPNVPAGITSSVHSLAATLMLAPLLDILGARNPGHRAWPWFVIIPMIVVLQWSTVSHLFAERLVTPVTTPPPATIGFLLILLMGSGNYFGTKNTSACLLGGTGIVLFLLPVTEWGTWPGDLSCAASGLFLAIAALLVEGRLKSCDSATGHDRLWTDFRDIYGLVWARRVMDRINQFAEREKWNVVMTLDGLQTRDNSELNTDECERPMEVIRWVLQRFADEDFLDRYLTGISTTQSY